MAGRDREWGAEERTALRRASATPPSRWHHRLQEYAGCTRFGGSTRSPRVCRRRRDICIPHGQTKLFQGYPGTVPGPAARCQRPPGPANSSRSYLHSRSSAFIRGFPSGGTPDLVDTAIVAILEAGRCWMTRARRAFAPGFKPEAVRPCSGALAWPGGCNDYHSGVCGSYRHRQYVNDCSAPQGVRWVCR